MSQTAIISDFDKEIDAARDDLVALCATLVAIDSVNPPGPTDRMADAVAQWLRARQTPAELVAFDDSAPNVVSRVVGGKPGKHVVFNAHMDTMPVGDERLWTVPPFALTSKDGRLYGLGMGNMKGALAAMCLVTTLINRQASELPGRLSMTAVSDEVMFGDRGTPFLLERHPDLIGDYLVSGEGPGFMGLAVAEKGLLWLDIEASGQSGHSSNARTRQTAPIELARLLVEIDKLNDRYADRPAELPAVSGGDSNLGFRLSVNVGALRSGGVRSQMAPSGVAELDIRLPPGLSVQDVENAIKALVPPGSSFAIKAVKAWNANWTAVDNILVTTAVDQITMVRGDAPVQVVRLPGSDARRWRDLGVPAICYGPQPTLSSGIDDYANELDLVDCAKIYAGIALRLMRGE